MENRTDLVVFASLVLLPQVAPALKNYKSLDPHDIPHVWEFPIPNTAFFGGGPAVSGPALDDIRAGRLNALAPKNLIDPTHELDHFYASLLEARVTRVLHYGDSPTTADLITADARALLQKQFGDAGHGLRSDRAARGPGTTIAAWRWSVVQLEDRRRRRRPS